MPVTISFIKTYMPVGWQRPDTSGKVPISAYNNAIQRDNLFNQTDFLYNLNTWGVKHEFMAGVEYGRQVTDNLRNTGFFNNQSQV